jgi:Protein of unknown function (DUF2905)
MGLGRVLVTAGLVLLAAGVAVLVLEKLNVPFGRLPGDVAWRGRHTTVYIPWVTCLLLSVLGSLVLWLINRIR